MDSSSGDSSVRNILLLTAGGIAATGVTYLLYRHFKVNAWEEIQEDDDVVSQSENTEPEAEGELMERKVLVLGLNGVGKSSLLQGLSHADNQKPVKPTAGFNVVCVQTQEVALNVWEIGGAESMRQYWPNFTHGVDILMYVIDASDKSRMNVAASELKKILSDECLDSTIPLLIVANKQDIAGALNDKQVLENLQLDFKTRTIETLATQSPPGVPCTCAGDIETVLRNL